MMKEQPGEGQGQGILKLELALQNMLQLLENLGICDLWLFWWQSSQVSLSLALRTLRMLLCLAAKTQNPDMWPILDLKH